MEKQLIPKLRFPEFDGKWLEKKLENISEKIQDGTHFSPKLYDTEKYRYITSKNVKNGHIDLSKMSFVNEESHRKIYKRCDVKKGDVLLTKDGTIGQACLNPFSEEISLLSSVAFIRLNDDFLHSFLLQLILSTYGQREIEKVIAGQALKRITLTKIRNFKYKFPPLPEQQKIASFLTDVDDKITKLTKKKDLLEQYKKGIMQKIFSQELKFKDDNGNIFPKWEEKKLGSICNYKNGGSFEQYVSNEGVYNLISLNSLDINGKLKPSHKKVTINDNSLDKGDLVMVLSDVAHGYFLGLTDIVPDNTFVLNQRMGALKPKININSYFLKTYINFNQKYFKLMGQGSSQQNLSKGDILKFTVKTPIIEEQTKIANFLSDIDEKIEALNAKIENSKTFKKGLLQQMFV